MRHALFVRGLCDLIFHVKSSPGGSSIHTVVEVGSFSGESTFTFCESFPEVHAVDTWDYSNVKWEGEVSDGDVRRIEAAFDRCVIFWNGTLHKHKGTSIDVARAWKGPVDLVYIDADHSYEAVSSDIDAWRPLVREGGWVTGHDFSDEYPGVKQAVFERFNHFVTFADNSWAVRLI